MNRKPNNQELTVRDLFDFASAAHLLDAPLRICDGMAVSYYPELKSLEIGRYELVIDVSDLQPVEFDELTKWAEIIPPPKMRMNCFDCTRGARALGRGSGAARPLTLHAPAASLASHSLAAAARRPPCIEFLSSGRHSRRSLGLAPCPHPMRCSLRGSRAASFGAPRTASLSSAASASLLGDRPAASRFARSARPIGRHLAAPFALAGSRPLCVGIRSACRRSLRFAPVAGARSGASHLLPRVRPAARAAFSRRPCRSAPAAPLLRLAPLAAPKFTFGIVRHPSNCIYAVLIFNLKNYIC